MRLVAFRKRLKFIINKKEEKTMQSYQGKVKCKIYAGG